MRDNIAQTTNDNIEFFDFDLEIFNTERFHIAALVGVNGNSNRAFSWKVESIFVGHNYHKFNLAVRDLVLNKNDTFQ